MKILQSRNWWIEKDLKWIIDNAEFMFLEKHDNRPHIVTKEKLDGTSSNCFKIGNDYWGILINSHAEYSPFRENYMVKQTCHVKEFFPEWIKTWSGDEFFNPSNFKVMISNIFRDTKRKDIIIEI